MHEAKSISQIVQHLLLFCSLTILIKNLKFCSSADAGIVLNLFLNFEQK